MDILRAEAAVRRLHARYADAVWRRDAHAFAACFAPAGEWRIAGMVLIGRADIAAAIARILADAKGVLIRFDTPIVALHASGATARTYVTEQCAWRSRPPNVSIGRYYEEFVTGSDGDPDNWLFGWRLFQTLYTGPADLSGSWHDEPDFGPPPGMPPRDLVPPRR